MSATKTRIDLLLVERGLAPSRTRAQAMVMAGGVYVGGQRIDKAGALVAADAELEFAQAPHPFVSRGGLKLDRALATFTPLGLSVTDRVAVDIGASTGGFTDCLLAHGAHKVFAIDVGYGQLAERLRQDPRVISRERTNARFLTAADFPEPITLIVVDASFIGIGHLMPAIQQIAQPGASLVALVKPQFEAGRAEATRGRGVIRNGETRDFAIDQARQAILRHAFHVIAETDSSVPGPKGNIERFVYAERDK